MSVNKKIGQDASINIKLKYKGDVTKKLCVLTYMYDKWETGRDYLVGVSCTQFRPGEEKTVTVRTKIPAFYSIGRYSCNGVSARVVADGRVLDEATNTCAVNVLPSNVELNGYMEEFCLCRGVDTSSRPWKPIGRTTEFGKHDRIYVFVHAHGAYFPNAYDVLRATVTGVVLKDYFVPGTETIMWYPSRAGTYDVYGYVYFYPPSSGWTGNLRIWAQLDFTEPERASWVAKIT